MLHTKIKPVLIVLSMQDTTHVKTLSHRDLESRPPSQKSHVIWQEQRRNMATASKQHGRVHSRRGNDGGLDLKWKKSLEKLLETAWTCLLLFTLDPCCSVNALLDWLLSVAHHNWWSLDSGVVGSTQDCEVIPIQDRWPWLFSEPIIGSNLLASRIIL